MRSSPYVISPEIGSRSMPPHCWKYVNCVISRPSSITCQPMPNAPSVGDSQLSSSNLMSCLRRSMPMASRSEEHTSELQSLRHLVCRLLLEKKKSTIGHREDRESSNTGSGYSIVLLLE